MRRLSTLVLVLFVLVGAACTKDAKNTQGPPAGGVPDACTLISSARLGTVLGRSVGPGTATSVSSQRSICVYGDGTITAVELASHYDATKQSIQAEGRATTEVSGVGKAAFFDPAGQLIAKGERFFVAVTAIGVSIDKLKVACREMLTAAGETA